MKQNLFLFMAGLLLLTIGVYAQSNTNSFYNTYRVQPGTAGAYTLDKDYMPEETAKFFNIDVPKKALIIVDKTLSMTYDTGVVKSVRNKSYTTADKPRNWVNNKATDSNGVMWQRSGSYPNYTYSVKDFNDPEYRTIPTGGSVDIEIPTYYERWELVQKNVIETINALQDSQCFNITFFNTSTSNMLGGSGVPTIYPKVDPVTGVNNGDTAVNFMNSTYNYNFQQDYTDLGKVIREDAKLVQDNVDAIFIVSDGESTVGSGDGTPAGSLSKLDSYRGYSWHQNGTVDKEENYEGAVLKYVDNNINKPIYVIWVGGAINESDVVYKFMKDLANVNGNAPNNRPVGQFIIAQ